MTTAELRAIMTDLGISQRQLARAAGLTHTAAYHWSRGAIAGRPAKIPATVVYLLRRAKRRGWWSKPPPVP